MFTIPSLLMHFIIILMLIGSFVAIFGKSNKPKEPAKPTALVPIGAYFNDLNRRIATANTFTELMVIRDLIEAISTREFAGDPKKCVRKALKASLSYSCKRRYNQINRDQIILNQ